MNATDFAKIAFAGTTSSAAGAGAAAGYGHFIPKTFQQVMNREGGSLLASNTDFQSILFDQKDKVDAFVKDSAHDLKKQIQTQDDRLTEIKSWCQTKASQTLDSVSNPAKYRDYYSNLCTTKGIKTVKGFLTKWRASGDWIEERNSSDHALSYKGVFAVYKNTTDFLNWINGKKGSNHKDQITSSTTNEQGHKVLKEVCESGLRMSWGSRTNEEMEKYFFFCTTKNDTIKGRLESQEKGWKQRTKWSGVKNTWYQTEGVHPTIKRTNNNTEPVGDDDYQKWCTSILVTRLGYSEQTYPNDYKFARQICKEDNAPAKP